MITEEKLIEIARQVNLLGMVKPTDGIYLDSLKALVHLAITEDRKQLANKIAQMPFGDTAASFAIWIKEQP
jgi:hypothetical protein